MRGSEGVSSPPGARVPGLTDREGGGGVLDLCGARYARSVCARVVRWFQGFARGFAAPLPACPVPQPSGNGTPLPAEAAQVLRSVRTSARGRRP